VVKYLISNEGNRGFRRENGNININIDDVLTSTPVVILQRRRPETEDLPELVQYHHSVQSDHLNMLVF
jgi:hypothetical protein